ncbi:MAG: DUF2461 domain-containing protein [Dysgonamonadaceae bacterium]|jgi:uncharacterized protein (TIGR02453 family)|nr:DUF2461 domain-containing protein [Dysgonamonadaceae bacterium]
MKSADVFTGFSPEMFKFFNDLKANNYKPWFDEHKHIYLDEVLAPMKAFATALSPAFYAIDPKINMNPNKVVSRIYRDIRFSKDKTPYRTNMWMSFQRLLTDWQRFPGFYLELYEDGYSYGMGMYMASKKEMDAFRSRVEYQPDEFREMTEDLIGKHGFEIGGDLYKRRTPSELPEYFQQWIQRKSVYLLKNRPLGKELHDEGFIEVMASEYLLLKPLYDLFADICEE